MALSAVVLVVLRRGTTRLKVIAKLYLSRTTDHCVGEALGGIVLMATMTTTVTATVTRVLKNTVTLRVLFRVPVGINDVLVLIIILFYRFAGTCGEVRGLVVLFISLVNFYFLVRVYVIGVS